MEELGRAARHRQLIAAALARGPLPLAPAGLSPLQPGALGVLGKTDAKDDDPSALASALQFLKYDPAQIARIEKFVGTIVQLGTVVSWVVSAAITVKDVLTLMGVLDEDDASKKLLEAIGTKVDAIYNYLEATDRKSQFEAANGWRGAAQQDRNAVANLALSRTQTDLDALWNKSSDLMTAINAMLGIGTGDIAFMRQTYGGHPSGYVYQNQIPDHWTDYAMPLWMETTGGRPVSNGDAADLASRIWDPGYYIDVLFEAITLRVAALAALEPGFRSTGQDRDDLRAIYAGLSLFVDTWDSNFLRTKIVGPLDPLDDINGRHRIYHPWISPGSSYLGPDMSQTTPPALPLGVIDPVSGVTAFDPFWRDALVLFYNTNSATQEGYWDIDNYDAAVAAARNRLQQLLQAVRDASGITRLETLRDAVFSLVVPSLESEFVTITPSTFARHTSPFGLGGVRQSEVLEEVDLGIIGEFAGQPGKKYRAIRYYQPIVKTFRIPMARRMDRSKIQLGYRVWTNSDHPPQSGPGPLPIDVKTTLTTYGSTTKSLDEMEVFPATPISFDLNSENGCIYDVYQTAIFSEDEEEVFENTGSVPKKTRLFLNPREGRISAHVDISFSFDGADAAHQFVGFADVRVTRLDTEDAAGGFMLDLAVYETKNVARFDSSAVNVQETAADSIRLHFAPTFLVVEADYFTDREAGLSAMHKMIAGLARRFEEAAPPRPGDPVEQIARVARYQQWLLDAHAQLSRQAPEEIRAAEKKYAVPVGRVAGAAVMPGRIST